MTTRPSDESAEASHNPFARFGTADLQVHTSYGDGMADALELLDRIEALTDLDVVAVTDHDDVGGALLAREIHARGHYRFEFVPGIELTTRSGHLLALWVDEPLRPLRPLGETVAAIHCLGGVAVIPHPFSYLTRSVGQRALERVIAAGDPEAIPDGIEVANLTLAGRVTGAKALRLNRERYGLAETGGSDAHFPEEVGTATTLFPGHTAEELRGAILARQTSGLKGHQVALRSIGARRLAMQQMRGLSVTPKNVLGPHVRRVRGMVRR
jgi:predicted metal-dependent phosphoesterase TrpH